MCSFYSCVTIETDQPFASDEVAVPPGDSVAIRHRPCVCIYNTIQSDLFQLSYMSIIIIIH